MKRERKGERKWRTNSNTCMNTRADHINRFKNNVIPRDRPQNLPPT